jgi:hypothetical protein
MAVGNIHRRKVSELCNINIGFSIRSYYSIILLNHITQPYYSTILLNHITSQVRKKNAKKRRRMQIKMMREMMRPPPRKIIPTKEALKQNEKYENRVFEMMKLRTIQRCGFFTDSSDNVNAADSSNDGNGTNTIYEQQYGLTTSMDGIVMRQIEKHLGIPEAEQLRRRYEPGLSALYEKLDHMRRGVYRRVCIHVFGDSTEQVFIQSKFNMHRTE